MKKSRFLLRIEYLIRHFDEENGIFSILKPFRSSPI